MSETRSEYDVAPAGSHDNASVDLAGTETIFTADTDDKWHSATYRHIAQGVLPHIVSLVQLNPR